jgi:arylsulfatase A-like enzyme
VRAIADKLLAEGKPGLRRELFRVQELLYDGEVATVDAEIKTLFAELQRRGCLDDAIVVITADHGEEFFEHGGLQHGKSLFGESVRVPLVLIAPGYQGGQRVDQNVSLVDVAPTLIDLLGLPPESRFEGRSLVPLLKSSSPATRLATWLGAPPQAAPAADVILELYPKSGDKYDNRNHVLGMVRESAKLLVDRDGTRLVYDLAADPGEQHPDPPTLEATAVTLGLALDDTNRNLAQRTGEGAAREPLDDATKESLRALGYEF